MLVTLVIGFTFSAAICVGFLWFATSWLRPDDATRFEAMLAPALIACAALDLRFPRVRCSLVRRQTPKELAMFLRPPLASFLWGLDTGTMISTFRASAASWAALLLVAAGWAPLWAGFVYAAAFCLPLTAILIVGAAKASRRLTTVRATLMAPQARVERLAVTATYLRLVSAGLALMAALGILATLVSHEAFS